MTARLEDHALPARPERLPLALDSRDVAAVLKVSERTAQRLIRSGQLGPYTELAGRLRVRRDAFWRALAGQMPRGRRPARRRLDVGAR